MQGNRSNPRGPRPGDMPGRWPRGMDNVSDIDDVARDALRAAINVDINKAGKVTRRSGYSKIDTASWHSLYDGCSWPCFFGVAGDKLCAIRLTPSNDGFKHEIVQLLTVDPEREMSFTEHNGKTYYSNGDQFGCISRSLDLLEWGVPTPTDGFRLTARSTGGLAVGTYSVCLTYLALTGEESAPTSAVYVSVAAGGGITLSGLPVAPVGIAVTRVYMSPTNGEALYWLIDLPPVATSGVLGKPATQGKMLETRNLSRVSPGVNLRSHNGRIYWVQDDRIGYTMPLNVGMTSETDSYLWYGGPINMLESVENGLYVGTDAMTVYLTGREPKSFNQSIVRNAGVVKGTGRVVDAAAFGGDSAGKVALFWTTDGVLCRGGAAGALTPMTQRRLALPEYVKGATLFREQDGIRQFLATMSRGGEGSGFSARDTATAEVVRNGVTLN